MPDSVGYPVPPVSNLEKLLYYAITGSEDYPIYYPPVSNLEKYLYYIIENGLGGVTNGYYYNGAFYKDEDHTTPITPKAGGLYYDLTGNMLYIYNGTSFDPVGISDYPLLTNKPQINGVTLIGDKSTQELHILASAAEVYNDYEEAVEDINDWAADHRGKGDNVYVKTLAVPDLWVSGVETTSVPYTYTSDEAIVTALATVGYVQFGYYRLSALETGKSGDRVEYFGSMADVTFAAVKKAFEEGKVVVFDRLSGSYTVPAIRMTLAWAHRTNATTIDAFGFVGFGWQGAVPSSQADVKVTLEWMYLKSNDSWERSNSDEVIELQYNRSASISGAGSTTKYPTTKAVVDYVAAQLAAQDKVELSFVTDNDEVVKYGFVGGVVND